MPKTVEELAKLIQKRDNISYKEALTAVRDCAVDMETAFFNGNLDLAELILKEDLGLEPDYMDLFIF